MNTNLTISLKITNWCNLNCAHCCERSDKNQPTNFMPLAKIDNYLSQSTQMFLHPDQLITIGGGEALAPYMIGDTKYIPSVLDLTYSYGYIPTIKTNGTWGNNDKLRKNILSDIASRAYKYSKLVTMDISVDEFHNNQDGVTKIIYDTLTTPEFCFAVRICLVGFNTEKSANAQQRLKQKLIQRGLDIHQTISGDWIIELPNGDGVYMYNDFNTPIFNQGRASDNKVFTSTDNPNDNDGFNCLQIDNKDYAIYNYIQREQINNRHLNEVLYSLMAHASAQR